MSERETDSSEISPKELLEKHRGLRAALRATDNEFGLASYGGAFCLEVQGLQARIAALDQEIQRRGLSPLDVVRPAELGDDSITGIGTVASTDLVALRKQEQNIRLQEMAAKATSQKSHTP